MWKVLHGGWKEKDLSCTARRAAASSSSSSFAFQCKREIEKMSEQAWSNRFLYCIIQSQISIQSHLDYKQDPTQFLLYLPLNQFYSNSRKLIISLEWISVWVSKRLYFKISTIQFLLPLKLFLCYQIFNSFQKKCLQFICSNCDTDTFAVS